MLVLFATVVAIWVPLFFLLWQKKNGFAVAALPANTVVKPTSALDVYDALNRSRAQASLAGPEPSDTSGRSAWDEKQRHELLRSLQEQETRLRREFEREVKRRTEQHYESLAREQAKLKRLWEEEREHLRQQQELRRKEQAEHAQRLAELKTQELKHKEEAHQLAEQKLRLATYSRASESELAAARAMCEQARRTEQARLAELARRKEALDLRERFLARKQTELLSQQAAERDRLQAEQVRRESLQAWQQNQQLAILRAQHFELARRHEELGRRELELEQQKADVQRRARGVTQAKIQAKRSEERARQARKEQEALSLVWQEQLNAATAPNGRASSSGRSSGGDGFGGCVIDTGNIKIFVQQHTTAYQPQRQAPLLAVFPGERLYHTNAQCRHVLSKNVYPRIYHPENRENYLLARHSLQHCPACECLAQDVGM